MADAATSTAIAPPYVSFVTFRNLLDRLHQTGVPDFIERDVMGSRMNGSIYGHLKASLKFLGLIDEKGKTTETLDRLANADLDERKKILRQVIESSYTFLFGSEAGDMDVTRTTTPKLKKRFEDQGIKPAVAQKSISFFLQAAYYAGIPLSNHVYKPKPPATRIRAPRASHEDKPKQQVNGSDEGNFNIVHQALETGNLDNQIDDLMVRIATKPIDEQERLFERVKLAMRYAELFGRAR